eukprot:364693-Chlamydomonas_euryale.AAC.6
MEQLGESWAAFVAGRSGLRPALVPLARHACLPHPTPPLHAVSLISYSIPEHISATISKLVIAAVALRGLRSRSCLEPVSYQPSRTFKNFLRQSKVKKAKRAEEGERLYIRDHTTLCQDVMHSDVLSTVPHMGKMTNATLPR